MAQTAKHTPGPWLLHEADDYSHVGAAIHIHAANEPVKNSSNAIIIVRPQIPYSEGKQYTADLLKNAEAQKANARLIAAAPNSLAANKLFLAWIDSGKIGFPDADKLDAAVAAARAVIAEVEGVK